MPFGWFPMDREFFVVVVTWHRSWHWKILFAVHFRLKKKFFNIFFFVNDGVSVAQ